MKKAADDLTAALIYIKFGTKPLNVLVDSLRFFRFLSNHVI